MSRVALVLMALLGGVPALMSAQEAVPVAIIGTGNVGGALGLRLASVHHHSDRYRRTSPAAPAEATRPRERPWE
jgi:hypothetical protein